MISIILYSLVFAASLAVLLKGASKVVSHASALAKEYGVSELMVGITLVALSTTLPEFSVSIISAFSGLGDVAAGTTMGSVIVNIGLIIGLPALLVPLKVAKSHVNEGLVMLMFVLMGSFFLYGGMYWYEGIWIVLFMAFYIWVLGKRIERAPIKPPKTKEEEPKSWKFWKKGINHHIYKTIIWGLVVFAGAQMMVFSTQNIGPMLGIPEYIIALLVIAVGTSLPELATSIMALAKGTRDLSIGNIMGANMFNMTALGVSSLITTIPAQPVLMMVTVPVMILISCLFVGMMRRGWNISRPEGLVLFAAYVAFVGLVMA